MSNGRAALQLIAAEPPSAPAPPPASAKELEIGRAAADACVYLCAGMIEFQENGRMQPSTKAAGAERIAKLATLKLDALGQIDNFAEIARREGLLQLQKNLDAEPDFRQRYGVAAGDKISSGLLDGTLEIVGRVVALEMSLRTN